jgi:two-component system, OmpR family, response regulator
MARILIIEDTVALAQGLRSVLQLNRHDVVVTHDGAAGIEAARTHDPDLVLLDLMLPDIHGFDILRTIRGEGRTMPVLVLTASGDGDVRRQCLELGASAFLPKPFQLGQLLGQVNALLGIDPSEPAAPPPAAPPPSAPANGGSGR